MVKKVDLPASATGVKVGLILAGNLPLVGWHDVMCAVLAGHDVHVKLSKTMLCCRVAWWPNGRKWCHTSPVQ